MYGNKVGMEETQEYNYPTSIVQHSTLLILSVVIVTCVANSQN